MPTETQITRGAETQEAMDLLADLCRGFIAHPEELNVQGADHGPEKSIVAVRCHPVDYPKIVGKQGKHHHSLQTILSAIARRRGRVVEFTLLPAARVPKPPDEFTENPRWTPEPMQRLLARVLDAAIGAGAYRLEHQDSGDVSTFVATGCGQGLDLPMAAHAIFHAIGKTQGRRVHVELKP